MRITFTTIPIAMVILTSSCSRSIVDRKPNSTLNGIWNFKSSVAQIHSKVVDSSADYIYSTDTTLNYTTNGGSGSITISPDSISSAGLFYSIADTLSIHYYTNRALILLTKIPISYSVNIDQLNIPVMMVGSDSMYFPSGAILKHPDSLGIPDPIIFSSAKYTLSGNTLTLTSIAKVDAVYPYDTGLPDTAMYHLYAVITATFYQ